MLKYLGCAHEMVTWFGLMVWASLPIESMDAVVWFWFRIGIGLHDLEMLR
jgi:hypothetical protein